MLSFVKMLAVLVFHALAVVTVNCLIWLEAKERDRLCDPTVLYDEMTVSNQISSNRLRLILCGIVALLLACASGVTLLQV